MSNHRAISSQEQFQILDLDINDGTTAKTIRFLKKNFVFLEVKSSTMNSLGYKKRGIVLDNQD